MDSGRSVDGHWTAQGTVKNCGFSTVDGKSEWGGILHIPATQIHRPLLKIPSFSPSTVPSTVRPLTVHCAKPDFRQNMYAFTPEVRLGDTTNVLRGR